MHAEHAERERQKQYSRTPRWSQVPADSGALNSECPGDNQGTQNISRAYYGQPAKVHLHLHEVPSALGESHSRLETTDACSRSLSLVSSGMGANQAVLPTCRSKPDHLKNRVLTLDFATNGAVAYLGDSSVCEFCCCSWKTRLARR